MASSSSSSATSASSTTETTSSLATGIAQHRSTTLPTSPPTVVATFSAAADISDMVPSIVVLMKEINSNYRVCSDTYNRMLNKVEYNEGCRVTNVLPPNLKIILANYNFPTNIGTINVAQAQQAEKDIHNAYLWKLHANRSQVHLMALKEAELAMTKWTSEDYIKNAILEKAPAIIEQRDIDYGIQVFKAFHQQQAEKHVNRSTTRIEKSKKRQRTQSSNNSGDEMSQEETSNLELPATATKSSKQPRSKSPAKLRSTGLEKQMELLTVSLKDLQQKFQSTLDGGQRAKPTTPKGARKQPSVSATKLDQRPILPSPQHLRQPTVRLPTSQYINNQQWMQHGLYQTEPLSYLPTDHRIYQHQQILPSEFVDQRILYGQQQQQPQSAHYYLPQQQIRMPYMSTNNVVPLPGYTIDRPVDIAYQSHLDSRGENVSHVRFNTRSTNNNNR